MSGLLQSGIVPSAGSVLPTLAIVGTASWLAGPTMHRWVCRGNAYVRGAAVGAALVFGCFVVAVPTIATAVMWGSLHNWLKLTLLGLWFGSPQGLWIGAVAGLLFAWGLSGRDGATS